VFNALQEDGITEQKFGHPHSLLRVPSENGTQSLIVGFLPHTGQSFTLIVKLIIFRLTSSYRFQHCSIHLATWCSGGMNRIVLPDPSIDIARSALSAYSSHN